MNLIFGLHFLTGEFLLVEFCPTTEEIAEKSFNFLNKTTLVDWHRGCFDWFPCGAGRGKLARTHRNY